MLGTKNIWIIIYFLSLALSLALRLLLERQLESQGIGFVLGSAFGIVLLTAILSLSCSGIYRLLKKKSMVAANRMTWAIWVVLVVLSTVDQFIKTP